MEKAGPSCQAQSAGHSRTDRFSTALDNFFLLMSWHGVRKLWLASGLLCFEMGLWGQGCYDTFPAPRAYTNCGGGQVCETQTCIPCFGCGTNCYCDQVGLCPCGSSYVRQNLCWYQACGGPIWVRKKQTPAGADIGVAGHEAARLTAAGDRSENQSGGGGHEARDDLLAGGGLCLLPGAATSSPQQNPVRNTRPKTGSSGRGCVPAAWFGSATPEAN